MPPTWQLLMWGLKALWGLLIFSYGACIGSLTNVIVYRLPLGISIVSPPSRCPNCQTRLSWRDNIPVLGLDHAQGPLPLLLQAHLRRVPHRRGDVGLLFVGLWLYFYVIPSYWKVQWLGVDWVRPWFLNDASQTWPTFVVFLVLFACMVAMTIIDARTFTIPALLTTVPVVVALPRATPLHAAVMGLLPNRSGAIRNQVAGWMWAIPTPHARPLGLDPGLIWRAVMGLAIAMALLKLRLLPQSFADYAEWEESRPQEAIAARYALREFRKSARGHSSPRARSRAGRPSLHRGRFPGAREA
jgi:leader peptidase (prepilin peptidase)/N-methyltransferase